MKKLLLILLSCLSVSIYSQGTCATSVNIAGPSTVTVPGITGTYATTCFNSTIADDGVTAMEGTWYKYTATATGNVTISSNLPVNIAPNSTDTRVSILTGTCAALVCNSSNDDVSATNFLSTVTFPVTSGTTYYIQWDNFYSAAGFNFTLSFVAVCQPVISYSQPTSLTATSATLNWSVPVSGAPALGYEVEYGLAGFVQGSAAGTIVTVLTNSLVLSGLNSGATYDYYIRSKCSASFFSTRSALTFTLIGPNGEAAIYSTTRGGSTGAEISAAANGAATRMGDAIVLGRSERFLKSITATLFSLVVTTPYTVTMSLYTDCPTVTGVGACGSGAGTLIPGSTITVAVTPSATAGIPQEVVFNYPSLDLSSEADNTITVMINASRANVNWTLGEVPTVGAMPAGETGNGFATRCGSTLAAGNNGCARNFGVPNNMQMRIIATPTTLNKKEFGIDTFSVYPNPVKNIISISNSENINVKSISISDLNGRFIKTENFSNVSDIKVNVSDLSSGMYLLNINSDQGIVIKKIVKE
jgi:Secretion system C-terminal sorting domain